MTKLEQKTVDSKREMEIMDALDEIRLRNARNERLKEVTMLAEKEQQEKWLREQQEEEDCEMEGKFAKRTDTDEQDTEVRTGCPNEQSGSQEDMEGQSEELVGTTSKLEL